MTTKIEVQAEERVGNLWGEEGKREKGEAPELQGELSHLSVYHGRQGNNLRKRGVGLT